MSGALRVTMLWPIFPPAVRGSGPARSAAGLLKELGDEIDFHVLTSAFDGPAQHPMSAVRSDEWVSTLGAKVWYSSRRRPSPRRIVSLIRDSDPDLIYINSMWSVRFAILPIIALRLSGSRVPLLIAPRGQLSSAALRIRPWRKRAAILAIRASRLVRRAAWHASTELERSDVQRVLGHKATTYVARDLRESIPPAMPDRSERPGAVRAVFFSRIAPMKNLDGLLRALARVESTLELTIAGPVSDPGHWRTCEELIERLPPNVTVSVHGEIQPHEVVQFLSGFDLFLLPTKGENFGHAILEALATGLPCIVGSETPWGAIQSRGAGWVVDATSPTEIAARVDEFVALEPAARLEMRKAALLVAEAAFDQTNGIEAHRSMFSEVASTGCGRGCRDTGTQGEPDAN